MIHHDMATSWPGWQELGSNHPNSSTLEAGTTNDAGARGVLRGLREFWRARAFQCQYISDAGDDDGDVDGSGTTKTTREQTSNYIERFPDDEADGGEWSSSDIVDGDGDESDNNHTASPRSGRHNGDSGDAAENNEDAKGSRG